jgi:uncharacterized SAM-binding protein YcdF (DUF218 family)
VVFKTFSLKNKIFLAAGILVLFSLLSLMVVVFSQAGRIYRFNETYDGVLLPPVDVIVVLAGGRGRIAAGAELWLRYHEHHPDPLLYISGPGKKITWDQLSQQIRSGIRSVIPIDHVILEKQSENTEENAQYFIRQAKQQGWKRIMLLTSSYHLKRAEYIFKSMIQMSKMNIQVDTYSVYQEPFNETDWMTSLHGIHVTLVEYFKWLWVRTMVEAPVKASQIVAPSVSPVP